MPAVDAFSATTGDEGGDLLAMSRHEYRRIELLSGEKLSLHRSMARATLDLNVNVRLTGASG